jgi:hypothetical protein
MTNEYDKLDDLIDEWHESDTDMPLHEYLGMSKEEYKRFVENDESAIKDKNSSS